MQNKIRGAFDAFFVQRALFRRHAGRRAAHDGVTMTAAMLAQRGACT